MGKPSCRTGKRVYTSRGAAVWALLRRHDVVLARLRRDRRARARRVARIVHLLHTGQRW